MGYGTTASALYSTAVGAEVEATESESLVVSGNVIAKNVHFVADPRLIDQSSVQHTKLDTLLDTVTTGLQVVTTSASSHLCRHQNKTSFECAEDRQLHVQVAGHDDGDGNDYAKEDDAHDLLTSRLHNRNLGNGDPFSPRTIHSRLENVESISAQAIIAALVGSVQMQQKQIAELQQQVAALRAGR